MNGHDAPQLASIGTTGEMAVLKRRVYLTYFAVALAGVMVLGHVLPLLDPTTARNLDVVVPTTLTFFGICFVVLWLRPAQLRAIEVAQYAAFYPLLLGLLALLLTNATTDTDRHAAVAAFSVWIPLVVGWAFIVFGSRGGPYASLTFIAAAATLVTAYHAGGETIGTRATTLALQSVVVSGIFVVLIYALSRLLERQTTSRLTAEIAAEYAIKDVLTGVFTRFALGVRFDQALALARRTESRLAVALVDLDDFKPVNDDLGHAAGDEVLRELAARMTATVRDADTVARLGGDEFVVLAFVDDASHARRVAERLVASTDEPVQANGLEARVGASVGVAVFPDDAGTADGLLAAADAAMYAAKAAGKKGVALASQAKPLPLEPDVERAPS